MIVADEPPTVLFLLIFSFQSNKYMHLSSYLEIE